MSTSIYVSITRQAALLDEMKTVAGNVANMSTPGYRRENLVFSEYVKETEDALQSVSMATARARYADTARGDLTPTGAPFDLAIDGQGYFQVQTPDGLRLTRAGSFTPSVDNTLVTADGYPVLGEGGAALFVPADAASVEVGPDGVMSADGQPIGRVELAMPVGPETSMRREAGMLFIPEGEVAPVDNPKIAQGFLEGSNVNAVLEISRMIEVQRAYEAGQSLMTQEDERIREAISTLTRQA